MSVVGAPALPLGETLKALVYLDWHLLLNRLRKMGRDPKRLLMWLFFLLVMFFAVAQFVFVRRYAPSSVTFLGSWLEPVARFVPGVALLWLGLAIAFTQKPVGLFQSAADGRFLCGSALGARPVIAWLYFRLVRKAIVQLPAIAFWFVFFATSVSGALAGILRFWAALGLFFVLPFSLSLTISKLHARRPMVTRIVGAILVALAVGAIAAAAAKVSGYSVPGTVSNLLLSLPPGAWVLDGFQGDWLSIVGLACLDVAALTLTVYIAGDVYPEVWQSSLRMIAVRRLMRQRGGILMPRETRAAMREAGFDQKPARRQTASSSRATWVPAGAWALLWKEWLAMLRTRGGLRLPLIIGLAAVLIGWAVGGGFGHLSPTISLNLLVLPLYLLLFMNVFMSFRLGTDLRNPLWWLSAASLRARLIVLTLARCLRQVIPLAAGLLAAAVAARSVTVFLLGWPSLAVMVWALQSMGIGIYTIIPNPTDLRGPGQLLRVFLLMVLLIPVLIIFTIALAATRHLSIGVGLAALTLALEGAGLLEFASYRLAGNGLAFAQAERR